MTGYYLYLQSGDGEIVERTVVAARDDAEACRRAEETRGRQRAELWHRARRVQVFASPLQSLVP